MFKQNSLVAILINPRVLAMLVVGFSSGLPLALTGSTLQAWFTESGINVVVIGALSLVGMPYVWKFLWSPLMDRFSLSTKSRRRGWILLTQIGLALSLVFLSYLTPQSQPVLMGVIALMIAFFSASQDIAVDAYRADVLLPEERGLGSAYFIFAYRMSMLVSGGLALVLAAYFGWQLTYQIMSVILLAAMIITYFTPEPRAATTTPTSLSVTVSGAFKELWQHEAIYLLLLFAIFYKLGDAFAVTLLTNFLLKGLGFSLAQIGLVYKIAGMAGTLLGVMAGGLLLVRMSLLRALWIFGIAQSVSTLLFMFLAMIGKDYFFMAFSVFIESFCSGMGTAAFIVFLMSLCGHRYTATQYACLSALTAIGRVCLGPFAGVMVLHWGWVSFYAWSFVLSFPGLILLGLLQGRVRFDAKLAEC